MMVFKYLQIAKQSIRQRRGRSLLTILGIICGISSITLLINFGLGAQKQITGEINADNNRLTVRSGQTVTRDQNGEINQYNLSQAGGILPSLKVDDLRSLQLNKAIDKVTPVVSLNEEIKDLSGNRFQNGHVIAADEDLLDLIGYEINHGANTLDDDKLTLVIGDEVAKELFNNSRPISHEIIIAEHDFIIVGVLKNPEKINPLNIDFNYRRAVIMPFGTLEQINAQKENETLIYEILVQTKAEVDNKIINEISKAVLINHKQKHDFTVFKNNGLVFVTSYIFRLFRNLVVVVSIIFLIIAGISLANAMQASVAERKLEISVRKAVGATNQQILNQFLIEALVISKIGGFLGVIIALTLGLVIDYWTPIRPVIQIDVIVLMLILSSLIGLIFGAQAAAQAALQKPWENFK